MKCLVEIFYKKPYENEVSAIKHFIRDGMNGKEKTDGEITYFEDDINKVSILKSVDVSIFQSLRLIQGEAIDNGAKVFESKERAKDYIDETRHINEDMEYEVMELTDELEDYHHYKTMFEGLPKK